jgi:hypothetical protein
MLWPAALALLALALSSLAPAGPLGAAAWWVTFTLGIPFVVAARAVAAWLGPSGGAWIIPLSVPLGLIPYLAADLLVQWIARRRERQAAGG